MSKKKINADDNGTIPVPDAMKMIENWKTYLDTSKQEFIVQSYYVPILSIQNLVKTNPTAQAVRMHIGLSDPTDPSTSQILLIPIVNGKPKPYINPNGDEGGLGDDTSSNIFDMSSPCPPDCGNGEGDDSQ